MWPFPMFFLAAEFEYNIRFPQAHLVCAWAGYFHLNNRKPKIYNTEAVNMGYDIGNS